MNILDRVLGTDSGAGYRPTAFDDADSQMRKVLEKQAELGGKPIETLSPEEARRQPTPADAVKAILRDRGMDPDADLGVATRDITIDGAAGPLPARLYGPKGDDAKDRPVVVYFHGGGWVIADIDVYDSSPRGVAKFADCLVISCEYRLAPEHKFPAAHDDAFAAYKWVLANIAQYGGDPARVAVMGESAGGNLAANVAIRARDEGVQAPAHMVLVYPVASNDMNSDSYVEWADAKPLGKPMMEWFVKHVFDDKSQTADPRINLVGADLNGLPDATIIRAEIDPLRSDGEKLAERLRAAGSQVRDHTFRGSTHEFFGMALAVPDAAAAQTLATHELKRAFGTAILPI